MTEEFGQERKIRAIRMTMTTISLCWSYHFFRVLDTDGVEMRSFPAILIS